MEDLNSRVPKGNPAANFDYVLLHVGLGAGVLRIVGLIFNYILQTNDMPLGIWDN